MEGMDMGDESLSSDTTMGDMDDESEMAEDEHMDEEMDVMVVREPAQTATITFTVTEASIGDWEFGCFEEDGAHWDDGMRGTIVVEES
jgi:plastocyanin